MFGYFYYMFYEFLMVLHATRFISNIFIQHQYKIVVDLVRKLNIQLCNLVNNLHHLFQ